MTSKTTSHRIDDRLSLLILVCFFFSGLTALIYEIIWMRMIGEVVGGAPFAVSAILFVFMGGMGGGSFLASRRIDNFNTTRLIRAYGSLELLIGVYAFCVPIILLLFKFLYSMLYNALFGFPLIYNFFIFAGALLLLGIPTLCMGATLPILCKFYVARLSHIGTHTGRLYGLNTIGAATGSMLCGFWMIQSLSVWGTLLIAVGINIAIGLICLGVSPQAAPAGRPGKQKRNTPRNRKDQHPQKPPQAGLSAETDPPTQPDWVIYAALVIFLISGFSAMTYEVIWTKLLGLLVGPTTYSFTIVLATFIIGLALGNMVFGWLADRVKNTIALLVATQIAAAFLALGASQIMGGGQLFFTKLIFNFKDHFTALSLAKAAALFALMMPPTLFLGATFPLVAKIYSRSLLYIGRSIGIAYTVNTVGAVLGSICAGLILIPFVGKENGLKIVIGLQLGVAVVTGFVVLIRQKSAGLKAVGLAAVAVVGLYLCIAYPAWNRHLLAKGKYHRFEEISFSQEVLPGTGWLDALFGGADILAPLERGELVYYGDGIGGFTTVLKYPGPFGVPEYSMANSGKMDASSLGDMNTQTALAHFPMLFAEDPKRVMVLGLASGITAGEVLHYPIEQLDVVDINDRVEAASRFFDPWNNNVLDDPRTRLIFQDGRAHLALTDKPYDVVISEPSNPWMAGMATLFTQDFFRIAKNKLTQNGIYVQWFHCYQMDWSTFTLIGRTFADVFPHSMLVSTSPQGFGRDYLLVGFNSAESELNWENARESIKYLKKSSNITMADPELYARQIVSEDLNLLFGQGPINTDDLPLLEFAAPKLMYSGQESSGRILHYLSGYPGLSRETKAIAGKVSRNPDTAIDFVAYALSIHSPFRNMVDLSQATPEQKNRFTELLEAYSMNNVLDFALIEDPDLVKRLRDNQIDVLQKRIPDLPSKAVPYSYLAGLYDDKGMRKKAIAYLKKSVEIDPDDAGNRNNLGFLLDQQGNAEEAIHHYKEALRVNPNSIISLGNLAFLSMDNNHMEDALHYFKEILRIKPDQPEAHYQIGTIYLARKEIDQAAKYFNKALAIQPDYKEARQALSQIQFNTN